MSILTGEGDYSVTGQYGLWNGQPKATSIGYEYTSLRTTASYLYNPWPANVPVTGTNGLQFSPQLTSDQTLQVYFSLLSRPIVFSYESTGDSPSSKF